MNIPMSVQADALQVLVPKATTDDTAIWVSAGATVVGALIGVVLGYVISECQRRKIERERELSEIHGNILYVQGVFAAQVNRINKWMEAVVENETEIFSKELSVRLTTISRIDFDYQRIAKIQKIYPEIMMEGFGLVDNIDNLNGMVKYLNVHMRQKKREFEEKGVDLAKVDFRELHTEYYKLFSLALNVSEKAEVCAENLFVRSRAYFRRAIKGSLYCRKVRKDISNYKKMFKMISYFEKLRNYDKKEGVTEKYKTMRLYHEDSFFDQREKFKKMISNLPPNNMK